MTRQEQQVGEGAEAYQSGTSLTVNRGMSPDQMAELMMAMATQLQQYLAEAGAKFDQRCAELRDELIEEFSKPNSEADSGAFRDPDYQFVLKEAHESYGRKGGDELREELVKLLGQRSMLTTGSRPALIINDAIRIAGNLTSEEYAALAMTFIIKNVSIGGMYPENLFKTFSLILEKFLPNLPKENHSYEYLVGIGCISVNLVSGVDLGKALVETYGFRFAKGFDGQELMVAIGEDTPLDKLAGALMKSRDGKFWLLGPKRENAVKNLEERELPQEVISRILALVDSKLLTEDEIKAEFLNNVPGFDRLHEIWGSTQIRQSNLTSLGKALAHSVLVSGIEFKAPLEIWIK